ncbi:putative Diguanylate phosphodiesterase (EAL domain) [Legionella birminghamensis]|uniref:Diguanylate phosphodiesterase (EAL domain) n=1 Tax=Legionella birminghamensis TaxID=28083 RepID=A0A378I8P9_9GAMM|nr:HDOD domain-containing protein [Legionella birminghamensis]KTC68104.1 putative Diguanylate phosphodiesterase (EAL domain) [Legionella birminghamensis]STX31186.1 putative signal transduction protein [Legionella birminghamensis]
MELNQPPVRTLLARQGIYDNTSSVLAYELLYRNSELENLNLALNSSGELATYSVLLDLFANLNIDAIVGNKRAFINFTYQHLIEQIPALLPRKRIAIEVLETVVINQEVISSIIALKNKGYEIALDDFVFREEIKPLLEVADIVKIDVLNLNEQQIVKQLSHLQVFKGKLLAEKVENKQQFDVCVNLGFDLFQGFFLDKPQALTGQAITENKAQILRLLAEINDEDLSVQRVEEIILQIPKLSYRILRLANSASIYSSRKIESLMDAITKLGLNQIRNWLSLLLLASHDEIASDLLERTLIRAKMCELLAKSMKYSAAQQAYTVGLLSTLDGILNEPMPSLLEKMGLSGALNDALLNYNGILGSILKAAIDYEHANFNELTHIRIESEVLTQSYLDAIEYANNVMEIISRKDPVVSAD